MSDLFTVEDATDLAYISLRDEPRHKQYRQSVEDLWVNFRPLADSQFTEAIASDFPRRFWEMYVGCTLLDAGFSVTSKDAGPDARVATDSSPIWVEATAPDAGSGADAVPPEVLGVSHHVPEDQIVLRLRSAIWDKHKAYLRYVEKKILSPKAPYIIAINGSNVPHSKFDDQPSFIVKSVFPFGLHTVTYDRKTTEVVDQGIQHRPVIPKQSGAPVETTVFENPEYSGISAIIYSRVEAWSMPGQMGADFQIIHNPLATNPIEHGWLAVGLELWATETELRSRQW